MSQPPRKREQQEFKDNKSTERKQFHVRVCRNGKTCQFGLNCTFWHSPDDIKVFLSKLNNRTKIYLFHYTFGYNPGTISIRANHVDKARTALYELFTTDLNKQKYIDLPGCWAQSLEDLIKIKDNFLGDSDVNWKHTDIKCKGVSDWIECKNFKEFISKAEPVVYDDEYGKIVHYSCLDG